MWGLTDVLNRAFRGRNVTGVISVLCIALYVASLVLDPGSLLRPRGPFDIFSPSGRALQMLGMTHGFAWAYGQWWTLVTSIYLHGSLLHILFNVLWIRQLGPAVEDLYGRTRLIVIFTVAGVAGFVVSNMISGFPTVGASGSIFGLLGAMVAYGRKRGGTFGAMVLRQYGQWALIMFVFGLLMPGVNNWAHGGGFAGGFLAGLALSFEDVRKESGLDRLLAAGCVVATVASFALALWTAFVA
jgi:rhomboid protease GluP